MAKSCVDCTFCKVKKGVLAYCAQGYWQKLNGEQKRISVAFLAKSRLVTQAEYCPDYDSEEEEDEDREDISLRSSS
jgi:hypothetical protein